MAKIPDDCPWKATRTLSQGGQAVVEGVEPREGSEFPAGSYAMKILRNAGSTQAVQRFERELQVIQGLQIPGLVRVVDASKPGSSFRYYVMPDYVADGYQPLDKVAFSPDSPFRANAKQCLEFVGRCADVLAMVHTQTPPVVHRDIKPANILCHTEDMTPLLLDFGCCQIEDDTAITLADEGVGTKDYMAPECESGASGDAEPRSDIYSLGKLLWSMVTGQRAFARENPAFSSKSMPNMLPEHPDCWHLTSIFEQSVRRKPQDR